MALVVIILTDEDDSVNVNLTTEPPIKTTGDSLSPAQSLALVMLEAASKE